MTTIRHQALPRDNPKERGRDLPVSLGVVLVIIGVAALVVSVGTLAFYYHYFSGPISVDQSVWGSFGDFLGGTLGAVFAFLTFVALLFTIAIQAKVLEATQHELKLARDAAETRAKQFLEEMTKAELFNMIKFVHSELERRFEKKAEFSPIGEPFGYYFSYSAPSVGEAEIPVNGTKVSAHDKMLLIDIIDLTSELNGYLSQYEAQFGASALTYFYKKRYATCAKRLTDKGFVVKQMMSAFQSIGYGWSATVSEQSMEAARQAAHSRDL